MTFGSHMCTLSRFLDTGAEPKCAKLLDEGECKEVVGEGMKVERGNCFN